MRLTDFKLLSFDCYGTLIDWESGLSAALAPLMARAGIGAEQALADFAREESAQEAETPAMRYSDILAHVHPRLARAWGTASTPAQDTAFGASIPDWPEFPDSPAALAVLKRHFKLVILSNVDRASFAGSSPIQSATSCQPPHRTLPIHSFPNGFQVWAMKRHTIITTC